MPTASAAWSIGVVHDEFSFNAIGAFAMGVHGAGFVGSPIGWCVDAQALAITALASFPARAFERLRRAHVSIAWDRRCAVRCRQPPADTEQLMVSRHPESAPCLPLPQTFAITHFKRTAESPSWTNF